MQVPSDSLSNSLACCCLHTMHSVSISMVECKQAVRADTRTHNVCLVAIHLFSQSNVHYEHQILKNTRTSAIAEKPADDLYELKCSPTVLRIMQTDYMSA